MCCSCGLLGSFLFARHVISSYNVLSGRTMFNINRKGGLFLALSILIAGSGCFLDNISTLRLHIVNTYRNFSYKEIHLTQIKESLPKKLVQDSKKGVFHAHYDSR